MRALQEGTLEKMVVSMVPAFPSGKIPHIPTFMSTHQAFSRAQLFLDQLLTRCCPPSIRSDAIQVFSTSGNMQSYNNQGDTPQDQLKKAVASVMGAWPDQIQYFGRPLLLPWFTLKQALVQGHLPASHPLGHVLSLWVELEHLEPTEAELEAAPEAPPEPQRAPEPEEGPAQGPVPGPAVPELFKRVLPHQCLGSVWSQRNKPGKKHLASTVHATITQFNNVATCVITTCLGDTSMRARDRAKVVEHWIKVAKKRPSRFATLLRTLRGTRKRPHKKCVPFLGKFLTDLEMLDTKLEDYLEGNQINLEKKEKEQRVMEKIVRLQEAANMYEIEPEEQFRAWFWALERLSEKER
ncbi:ral guanine nucleotide dissociation stimulator-like [Molossus molossus]|uniref:ral guanine nucleotide dissociation stimulator-like n=1 Tax=Molossus molossus TaxID=27622 RepID=UPI0017473F12|nr:ral guanine nucleotide dissociation stimulator-like [Molossus molossus]